MSVPRIVIDLEKSKNPCSGLGQFSLNLGQSLIREAETTGLDPIPLVAAESARLYPHRTTMLSQWWHKERFQRWYRFAVPRRYYPRVDLWHATHQQVRFLPLDAQVPLVLTIHDLNYLREKAGDKVDRNHQRIQSLINRATAVTTISQFVASEVRGHFRLENKEVRVIYNGRPQQQPIRSERPPWLAYDVKFLFTIGIEPYGEAPSHQRLFHVVVGCSDEKI
jgi:hypothetical protein